MKENEKRWWGEFMGGALLEQWPRNEQDEPEEPALLCSITSKNLSDQLVVNMLQACGIPSLCLERGNGSLGKLYLGISGYGTDIYVPVSLLHDAKMLYKEEYNEEL